MGRHSELAAVRRALALESDTRRRLTLIAGEAGVGKSRLATELAAAARSCGRPVLWGTCTEAGSALPLLPINEAIGNYVASAGAERLRGALGGMAEPLGRLVPSLGAADAPEPGDVTFARLRLFEAVLKLVRVLAEGPGLALVLDDLHLADAETLDLLDFLVRRIDGLPAALVATYCSDALDREHPLGRLVNAWRRPALAETVVLLPLRRAEVATMLADLLGGRAHSELVDAVWARSDGIPYLVEELLGAALEDGRLERAGALWRLRSGADLRLPATVADSVLLRLDRLTEPQREIVRAAAGIGCELDLPALLDVVEAPGCEIEAALVAAAREHLIEYTPEARGHVRFCRAVTHEVLLRGSSPAPSAPPPAPSASESRLTSRELELLALVASGATNKQIAVSLGISVATVRTHLDRIRDKTDRRRRSDLTRLAVELGL